MPDPLQHRFARPALRKWFRYIAAALLSTVLLSIGSAMAWADESITIDFVRHGEAGDMSVINTEVPGPSLVDDGPEQASIVAQALYAEYGKSIAGVYASDMIRTQETAAPLAALLPPPISTVEDLPGLNEIDAGVFEGLPVNVGDIPLGGALYLLAPFLWTLGLDFVPELGSTTDPNGIAFDEQFSGAVQTIYENTISNGDGNLTDVAFSGEGAMFAWTLMNVNNPDFPLVLEQFLTTGELVPYTGSVVVQGDPEDGWTLVSFDGQPVPPASLPTELFVDVRDLITSPQFAAYNIWEAVLTGDPTTIVNAIQAGVNEVGTATVDFPIAVIRDISDAVQGDISNALANLGSGLNVDTLLGDLSTELANLVPTMSSEVTGLSGELGAMAGEALAAL